MFCPEDYFDCSSQDHKTQDENKWLVLMDIFLSTHLIFCRKSLQLQIPYSILSIKNRYSVEEDTHTHAHTNTRTWPPWAMAGGQDGAKDMHILKVID